MAPKQESITSWDEEVDISELLKGDGGKLLRDYADIDPAKMDEHVKDIARKGWQVNRYPCFHRFLFLNLDLSRSPVYQHIVEQIKSGHLFLDLGCGVGQDIRRLIQDGAPAENLIGLDLIPNYIDLGYQLFQDRSKLTSSFIIQDFFEDTPETDRLIERVKVINSGYFMHFWDWDKQLIVAKRMIRLLTPEEGATVAGMHFGKHTPGYLDEIPAGFDPAFLHNQDTLSELWAQAGRETQTTWTIQIEVEHDEYCLDIHPEGCVLRWAATRQ